MNKIKILSGAITSALLVGLAHNAMAHEVSNIALGQSATFVGAALVSCFDDGNGSPNHIITSIRDNSPPVPGLLTTLHVSKGGQVVNTTDAVSGDADYSPSVVLRQGSGPYFLIASKTGIGERSFDVTYHCETANGTHTGTDISVTQYGEAASK